MGTELGPLQAKFFAFSQLRELKAIESGALRQPLGLSAEQETQLLGRMARRGLIARVRRGLYLVPPRLPAGRWTPSEAMALNALIGDREGKYQITGPNAFYRYGWIDQVPNRLYVYNDQLSGDRQIGAVNLTLIKVASDRIGAVEKVKSPDGPTLSYSSRSRALVDAVYDWSRFNTLPRAYDWIKAELSQDEDGAAKLVKAAIRFSNLGTLRRLGKLLELEGVDERLLRRIENHLTDSSGLIPWVPNRPKRGILDRRWGIIFNGDTR